MPKWPRARVCVDVRACMHVCPVCVYIFACLHAHACICVVARVGMCAYVRTYVFVCVRACVHACTSVSSVRAKGQNHFFKSTFLRRLQINCLPISILPN